MTPAMVADPLREASRWLTVGAMATLGLSVDTRVVAKVGRPVITTVLASLVILIAVSAGLIRLLGI